MKKIFFVILLTLPFLGAAQSPTQWETNRAKIFSDHVVNNMELTSEDSEFIQQVFLDRVVNARKKIKGKELSQEEKRAVYSQEYKNSKTKLTDRFGKRKATKIMNLSNEALKKADAN